MSEEQVSLDDFDEVADEAGSSTNGWQQIEMGELAEYQNGNAFSKSEWTDDGYPIIRIQNLTGEQEEFNYFDGELEDRYRVKNGDLLLSWSATIDVFEWNGPEAALNQHIYRVDTTDQVNEIFLRFKLEELLPRLEALSHGSTMKHVRKADLVNLDADIPPLEEQRKIASVLYTVDQAIQKTDEIIDQTKKVKKGLMQDLFLDGYYTHDEYEDIRIGPFVYSKPAEWEMETIESSKDGENGLRRGPFGGMLKKEIFIDSGYKVYQQQNVIYDDFDYGDYYITEEKYRDMQRFSVDSGDLLISCSGTLGKVAKVPQDYEEGVINQALLKFSVDKELFDIGYMKYFLESKIGQRQLVLSSRGSAMKNMAPMEFVRATKIFKPKKEEQKKISDCLSSLDARIEFEAERKDQLKRLKRGLMQDLLSGEVRTHDKDIELVDDVLQHG